MLFVERRGSSLYMKSCGYRTKYHFVLQVKVAEGLINWQIRAAEGLVHKMSANISYHGIQINFTPGISMLIEQIG